jgi:hypothetical protein
MIGILWHFRSVFFYGNDTVPVRIGFVTQEYSIWALQAKAEILKHKQAPGRLHFPRSFPFGFTEIHVALCINSRQQNEGGVGM